MCNKSNLGIELRFDSHLKIRSISTKRRRRRKLTMYPQFIQLLTKRTILVGEQGYQIHPNLENNRHETSQLEGKH